MKQLEELYHLYAAYEEKAKSVRRRASRYAGIFGLGDDPRKHECHEVFFEDVARWVQTFLAENPSQQEILQAVSWILKAADSHRNTDIYGYLYAAQGHVREMIPRLTQEDSLALLKWYEAAYPEEDRLVVQLEVYRLLQKQAGICPDGRSWLPGFFRRK